MLITCGEKKVDSAQPHSHVHGNEDGINCEHWVNQHQSAQSPVTITSFSIK